MLDRHLLRDELVRDEGLRLTVYLDTVGLWTIGVGHLLGGSPRMSTITRDEAFALLEFDIDDAIRRATVYAPEVMLDPVRSRVLVNMAFNLGDRLGEFKRFLEAVRARNWAKAAEEMMDSKWARQVGKRAERLRDMMLGD